MKNFQFVLMFFFMIPSVEAQVSEKSGVFFAKEFSKEIALFNAKSFVMTQVLGESTGVTKFEIDPLAAASLGELTSLVYKCDEKNKAGLILGFYGTRWNDAGVIFQQYSFLNLPEEKAKEMLNKIDAVIDENYKYLTSDIDNNNVYYRYGDMTFLICLRITSTRIRVFWNGFDSEWEFTAFKRTKKRLEKKLN